MDSIYVISMNLYNSWKEGVTAHFQGSTLRLWEGRRVLPEVQPRLLQSRVFLNGW